MLNATTTAGAAAQPGHYCSLRRAAGRDQRRLQRLHYSRHQHHFRLYDPRGQL
jgi:hypothetical protein